MRFLQRTVVFVNTQALVNETCDEKRFEKTVNTALAQIRNGVHDGLFTAKSGEENWGIAHRILMPAFGPISIRNMYDEMHDIASQLALKWARSGPASEIEVTDDFTRLTLDTLALCSMGYRFNSYYSTQMHPFIEAMGDFLTEAGSRSRRPLPQVFYRARNEKFDKDIEVLRSTAREVLEARKAGLGERDNDLLAAMLKGVDSKTGKKMTDESIMDNLITFLIAGHETTSGLLSFAFYNLCKHPDAYAKAQAEVDAVVGKGPIHVEHLANLPYMNGVLRETLRVNATIPLFAVMPFEDTLLAGKYPVKQGETILNLLAKSQLDPKVFGPDADEFKPERMMDENFNRLNREFPNCWKPFGNGMRGCIGRPFAWQEALLVMVMLLQNFNFVLRPGYDLTIKQTLTIKPSKMTMRAILRDGLTATSLERRLNGTITSDASAAVHSKIGTSDDNASGKGGIPLTVLYGSNSGTCDALAQRLAMDAAEHGFRAVKIDCLDTANQNLPRGQPVIVITASYEGQPPDNAGLFVKWLESLAEKKNDGGKEDQLQGVEYAVFGCGHKDWVQTYHRVPKHVDALLEKLGAEKLAETGLTDVSSGDTFMEFESWEDSVFWPALKAKYGSPKAISSTDSSASTDGTLPGRLHAVISNPRKSTLRQDVYEALVIKSQTLTSKEETEVVKKHVEIRLPEGLKYTAGDYLAVLPINPKETVQRAIRLLRLARDAHVTLSTEGPSTLPVDRAIPVDDVLSSYVELSQPATKRVSLSLFSFPVQNEQIY